MSSSQWVADLIDKWVMEKVYGEIMQTDFNAVGEFHQKFDLPSTTWDSIPGHISNEARNFRMKFLMEEMSELADGYGLKLLWRLDEKPGATRDLPKIADALIDLVYVALGTAHMHRLPWSALFSEVQRANMTKMRAKKDGSDSTRSSSFDVVKPAGWRPPAIEKILANAGWNGPELPLEGDPQAVFLDPPMTLAQVMEKKYEEPLRVFIPGTNIEIDPPLIK